MRTMQGAREVTVDRLRNRSKTFDQHFDGHSVHHFLAGANGGTRTLKSVKTQASETCAYTNSATFAYKGEKICDALRQNTTIFTALRQLR